jgi:hypothetical protein
VKDSTTARALGPDDGKAGRLGSIGVRFMIDGDETGGGFSLVEHPMPPRALAAPLHRQEMIDLLQQGGPPDPAALAALAAGYELEVDLESIPRLTQEFGLQFGPAA